MHRCRGAECNQAEKHSSLPQRNGPTTSLDAPTPQLTVMVGFHTVHTCTEATVPGRRADSFMSAVRAYSRAAPGRSLRAATPFSRSTTCSGEADTDASPARM